MITTIVSYLLTPKLTTLHNFACADSNVLSVDTTFNLCKNWLTDTCYNNIRLETLEGMAIYNGFAMDNAELKLLLCVYHLEKSDRHKLSKLNPKNGAVNKILADIYGC